MDVLFPRDVGWTAYNGGGFFGVVPIQAFFKAWCGVNLAGQEKKMWTTLFYVIIWSIWNLRNRVVLEQYKPDWSFELRQIKVRWGFWLKSWLDGKNVITEELSSNPFALRKWRWLIQIG